MPRVFISYRRDDSAGHAGRLFDRLSDHFGPGQVFMDQVFMDQVFMDVEGTQPGVDYIEAVLQAVQSCEVLIAVIGKEWLEASDVTGARRLDDAADLVRVEIATALGRNIRVIPVLVRGAGAPPSTDLPDALEPLAHRNALELSDTRFSSDVRRLIDVIQAPAAEDSIGSGLVGRQTPGPGHPTGGPFVGRRRELGELLTALEDTLSGHGKVVMLVGEPGIGKTRLAQELTFRAAEMGAEVLSGRCYEGEGAPPYWPWVQLIRAYLQRKDPSQLLSEMGPGAADIAEIVSEVREKLPGLAPPPPLEPEQARFRLFDSITTFLKNAAQRQPITLLLDDLHWADRSSLLLLEFLSREMRESRLLVIGTYRDVELSRQHPLSDTLARLTREPVFRRQLLRGLSRKDTRAIIETAAGVDVSNRLLEGVYAHTEGNPFFIAEVIWLLAERGELTADSIGGPQGIPIPEGVRQLIGQRLNRLSEQCVQTLTLASVVGREFGFELLSRLTDDLNEDQLLMVIDEALEVHLIEELPGGGERYEFSHALIQQTLTDELSASRKVRLHARIGRALEELYAGDVEGHATELAHHFAEAAASTDTDKLVRYSLLAGEQALAAYAYEEALKHFQRALAAKKGQPTDAETAALLAGTGRIQVALAERHEMQEAVDNLIQAFDYYANTGDVERAVAVAQSQLPYPLVLKGKVQLLGRALKLVPPDSHEAGSLLPNYGRELGMCEADYKGAQRAFDQGLAIALREQDTALELRILANAAHVDLFNLDFHGNLEKGFRAIGLASRVADLGFEEEHARRYTTMSLLSIGDLDRGRQQAEATLHIAEQLHQRSLLGWAEWLNAEVAFLEGDWGTARRHSDRALALMPRAMHILAQRAHLECEQGNFGDADTYLHRLLEVQHLFSPAPGLEFSVPAVLIPVIARITGRFDRLDSVIQSAESVLGSPYVLPRHAMSARAGLAILAVQQCDSAACVELYAALKSQSGTLVSLLFLCADRLLGLLSRTVDEPDQAIGHFEDALTFCRESGCRPELAWSCHDYAESLLQRNDPADHEKALALLQESGDIAKELGMRPLAGRVTALQERTISPPGKAPTYPDRLTQREVEVLHLVAAGKSNREIAEELFISLRTVAYHVGNILNKTSSANRAEAAAYATRLGLV